MLRPTLFMAATALALAASLQWASAKDSQPIFNGKDLSGWDGDSKIWSVKDGVIVGQSSKENPVKANTFLIWTNGTVSDFEFTCKYRITPSSPGGFGNSGIQYRSKMMDAATWSVGGYQADLEAGPNYSGILYEERLGRGIMAMPGEKVVWTPDCKKEVKGSLGSSKEVHAGIKVGEWNEYTIVAQGNHLKHFINGKQIVDVLDNCADKAATAGVLALQMHAGEPFKIEFKDLRLTQGETGDGSKTLTVVSYNLRFASKTPPNAWPDRRPLVSTLVKQMAPDVMGTQEGVYWQLLDLANDLPGYKWVGVGRDDGKIGGEFMAVFYKTARLQPLSTNHFWLSDTPEVAGTTTWGNTHKRMATWLKFRDLVTGQEFHFINTHYDHRVQLAREKSSELVRQRVQALNDKLPVLLAGDFNAPAEDNKSYDILVKDGFFKDTWLAADKRAGEGYATFNGFEKLDKSGVRIDWILAHGKVHTHYAEIVTYSKDGTFPSDHCPIMSRISFPTEGKK